jgi:hypothetical protein
MVAFGALSLGSHRSKVDWGLLFAVDIYAIVCLYHHWVPVMRNLLRMRGPESRNQGQKR